MKADGSDASPSCRIQMLDCLRDPKLGWPWSGFRATPRMWRFGVGQKSGSGRHMAGDDSLQRKKDIKQGMAYVTKVEKEALPVLQKLKESPPPDSSRYEFVLKDTLDTTADSLDGMKGDVDKRAAAV